MVYHSAITNLPKYTRRSVYRMIWIQAYSCPGRASAPLQRPFRRISQNTFRGVGGGHDTRTCGRTGKSRYLCPPRHHKVWRKRSSHGLFRLRSVSSSRSWMSCARNGGQDGVSGRRGDLLATTHWLSYQSTSTTPPPSKSGHPSVIVCPCIMPTAVAPTSAA